MQDIFTIYHLLWKILGDYSEGCLRTEFLEEYRCKAGRGWDHREGESSIAAYEEIFILAQEAIETNKGEAQNVESNKQ